MAETDGSELDAQPMVIPGRSMAILYGTETGNSEDIARELGDMAERLHFQTIVDEMNSFNLKDFLHYNLVIFVCSTTGQGDMPGNALDLWKNLLRKRLRPGCLSTLKFTIFGLGDSSYPKFNWAARKLHKRLTQLGASEFYASGEGDERHDDGIDSIYLPWHQGLRAALLADYPLPASIEPMPEDVQLPPKMLLRFAFDANGETAVSQSTKAAGVDGVLKQVASCLPETLQPKSIDLDSLKSTPVPELPPPDLLPIPGSRVARVAQNKRITPQAHWQDVRELRFSVELDPADHIDVGPGSTLTIYPKNYPQDVQALIDMMEWREVADQPLSWVSYIGPPSVSHSSEHDVTTHFPKPGKIRASQGATLRYLLTNIFDITAVPTRNFLKELIYYTSDPLERERLLEFTSKGNADEFYDYTFRPRRTILEALSDFPKVKIPFERVIDTFPVIRGREFSIANGAETLKSGPEANIINVHILAALVEYRTIIRKPRQGLCSRYLKTLPEGTSINVKIKRNSSSLMADHSLDSRPLITIATGTGIAPIKHMIEDRFSRTTPSTRGETVLFFGCRNEHADYYYRDYWESQQGLKVIPAFSRDPVPATISDTIVSTSQTPDYDAGKNYVQHQIRRHARLVAELVAKDAMICVCGNSGRMPKSVREALIDSIVLGGLTDNKEEAEKIFLKLRFWQETW
ncbi:riboflavin synthase domain-like protein [Coniochaeta sp. PMI_546]|nr:riboflavin synthase domain-like protein [Coniochaeta sp. PMI_546]